MTDQNLLNIVINCEDVAKRETAMDMLTRRVRTQKVNRSVTLIKGNLQLLDLPKTTQRERRDQAKSAFVKFKLCQDELEGVDFA